MRHYNKPVFETAYLTVYYHHSEEVYEAFVHGEKLIGEYASIEACKAAQTATPKKLSALWEKAKEQKRTITYQDLKGL